MPIDLSIPPKRTAQSPGGPVRVVLVLLAMLAAVLATMPAADAQRAAPPHVEDAAPGRSSPEAASARTAKPLVAAARHMAVAAHPLAAEAARDMLRRGGSATDAAIAAALVLNLVEPQSSGIGGGGFALVLDAATGAVTTYDGRETAPAAARGDRFLRDGRPMPFAEAVHSGLSVGVPGLVRMFEMMHAAHGRLRWADLVVPAARIARAGFPVSPRLNRLLTVSGPGRFDAAARAYFFDEDGAPRPVGYLLRNPDFATTLEAIAAGGATAFYEGPIAERIVTAVAAAPLSLTDMTAADLAGYRAVERPPVCTGYRQKRICGMGAPSSGGITVAQTLKLIEPFGIAAAGTMTPRAAHIIAEAEKLAYADRDRYLGDPAFTDVPSGLLDEGYIASRRLHVDPDLAMSRPSAGEPPGLATPLPGADATRERAGTTHLSIVDGDGNSVALTASIEGAFGSGLMAAGFLLNNELTDFSFRPSDASGRAIANRVEGGKRPRSSMAPTLVLDADGRIRAVLGSPGGNRIILYVVKALVGLLDWESDAAGAAALANFGSRGGAFELERDWSNVPLGAALAMRGHRIHYDEMTSGLHIIVRKGGQLQGGADPRREGVALGD